ncbi:type II toxin-antitoxin system ParD family antitoxin [Methylobacterium sp. E-005]|uniref:type II toxin-antitoxin system ParD family antitoxin n=1 Tax=Methylobacterium sp. E-005 TaxID=2836549 RepID=UPI001FB8F935|nr:type II toxin-antitoxin system ParD family antitoxin [Methylobacterium sp. E-005]MCJ2087083.1 type II toxin-antitoxin system ParD family antitoxin [Methylobacterium sp. E-005]
MPWRYTLDDQDESFARALVASGRYASVDEVRRHGLRLVAAREQHRQAELEVLQRDIREGLESGVAEPLNLEAVKAEGRRRPLPVGRK